MTLTAAAATGSTFAGWSGACSGTGTCTVSMTAARSVTATFNSVSYALSVSKGDWVQAPSPAARPASLRQHLLGELRLRHQRDADRRSRRQARPLPAGQVPVPAPAPAP
ncbi:MAG: hypothetical protein IPM30_16385 [Burkholderiales bacterium]|nr:hypothetical protein [Burkholderiales bacterium]